MQQDDKPVLVYTTYPGAEAAEKAGRALVEGRLAACVNILPAMTSLYRWEGALQRDSEAVMIVKTRASLADAIVREVRAAHPYSNPAILVMPVVSGSPDYIAWLMQGTGPPPAA